MKQLSLTEFDQKMNAFLRTPELEPSVDQDPLHNGLQARGRETVQTVGFGVSASLELFRLAKEQNCDVIVVHHGMPVPQKHLGEVTFKRFKYLIQNDLSLWSAHYLLDAHPIVGNNVQILQLLDAEQLKPYTGSNGIAWGYSGNFQTPQSLDAIVNKLQPLSSPSTIIYDFGPKDIKRVVCVSGSGAPRLEELDALKEQKIDLYITGEVSEWTREMIREAGIHLIAGGHYHTETFGVKALQDVVRNEWGLQTVWLDLPNTI